MTQRNEERKEETYCKSTAKGIPQGEYTRIEHSNDLTMNKMELMKVQ
jgi:hypothetical protein